jgi:hypothetical protein
LILESGWLEPMAQRIKDDPTVIQLPRNSDVIKLCAICILRCSTKFESVKGLCVTEFSINIWPL